MFLCDVGEKTFDHIKLKILSYRSRQYSDYSTILVGLLATTVAG
ncbi:MAG: hypothetical protein ACD_50C00102G0001 [uncultured bacterium]|nr:MAG: hypothetical protein ACD_50C00102G0001 [uncultured bacterium]